MYLSNKYVQESIRHRSPSDIHIDVLGFSFEGRKLVSTCTYNVSISSNPSRSIHISFSLQLVNKTDYINVHTARPSLCFRFSSVFQGTASYKLFLLQKLIAA
jgi:hypothetical protein